jgi:hypothetical protein
MARWTVVVVAHYSLGMLASVRASGFPGVPRFIWRALFTCASFACPGPDSDRYAIFNTGEHVMDMRGTCLHSSNGMYAGHTVRYLLLQP